MWSAEMPSNIALIKYMGKTDSTVNLPTNPSISYTLNKLLTRVELTEGKTEDQWKPLDTEGFTAPELSEKGQNRFINHFQNLKRHWGIEGVYCIQSANNFPSDCGLASSASSFAALTAATYELAKQKYGADETLLSLANLSRKGSGSSCRSFFSPWCEWNGDRVEPVDLPQNELQHKVVVVEDSKKLVSSSEAHLRVTSSDLFNGRIERASKRCEELKSALKNNQMRIAFDICWAEFWDMHALFETSLPSFSYMTGDSVEVVHKVRDYWNKNNSGPLVTMDAGANVHLLNADEVFLASGCLDSYNVIG